ncbi:dihydroorotase [Nitratifractor salsuginis]|uniref:Dihydroorotase n=1 Tax=Nitratifractor salsuginis (strain DSM 16511 / JCM 12458 / E9I37-1) TaxID=749222 RepID=E6WYQ7_NITSE|nr:dihydroorotase [Nitratifractor salsuginis]ADV45428.1 dihydroorotase [Nitratifractor salsuginis DSM 16511]
MTELLLHEPLDMHLHLRDGEMLRTVAPLSAHSFSGALIMPNLIPPITDAESLRAYRQRILEAIGDEIFEPYMTLFFKAEYDLDFLAPLAEEVTAIKLYPAGITTNSEGGVSGFDLETLSPALEAMSKLGIPLCIHGESSGFVMDREKEFVPVYEALADAFPDLAIVMEHITTAESLEALERHPNLFATITLHHLLITLDDVAGGMLQPHLFCKPIAKRPEDREALLRAALEAHPKVMFGSDSAPHPRHTKEAPGCAAGVFTAPIALPVLAELFAQHDKLENLQHFVSNNAQRIYDITPPKKKVRLTDTPMKVPERYGEVVPMFAGEEIGWSIAEVSEE